MVLIIYIRNGDGTFKHITNFNKIYPNMAEILIEQYKLYNNSFITVNETRRVDLPHYKGYQTKFKNIYSGTVEDFKKFTLDLCRKTIWKKDV